MHDCPELPIALRLFEIKLLNMTDSAALLSSIFISLAIMFSIITEERINSKFDMSAFEI